VSKNCVVHDKFYVSLDAPAAISVSMVLTQAVLPKTFGWPIGS
jgi:hypothetical protein